MVLVSLMYILNQKLIHNKKLTHLLDNLSAVKGLKSTLLTPTELSNGNTISTNLLTNNGAYVVFTATDTWRNR